MLTQIKANLPTMKSLKTISDGEATKISAASAQESAVEEEQPMGASKPGVGGKTRDECPRLGSSGVDLGAALTRVFTTESSLTGRKRGFFR